MLKRLVAYLMGHLRIDVTGGRMERFLNLALQQGLYLWGIRRTPEKMSASLSISDFFALRPVARGSGCRVRIRGRYGLPFKLAQLRRRPLLIAGAAACLVFIMWASNHVWIVKVKVTGPQNLDPRAVEAVAAEAGLRLGASKSGIDVKRVEKHVQERMGEISVAVVRLQGTRAVIEVVEKAAQRPPSQATCVNLVARVGGVIEEVVPFMGEPLVKKGDIVKAGDVLVECSLRYWEGGRPLVVPGAEKPPRTGVARTGVAQAIVRARVTYPRYMEIPLVQEIAVPTGRTAERWVLNYGEKSILLRGKDGIPFARYREERKTYHLWRNQPGPVELVMVTAEEIELKRDRISVEQALAQARGQMADQLTWLLGPSDKILSPLTAELVEQGADYAGIYVTVETLEEIARPTRP